MDALWQGIRVKRMISPIFQLSELFVELFANADPWDGLVQDQPGGRERSMDICVASAPGEENHGTRKSALKTLGAIVDKINRGIRLMQG